MTADPMPTQRRTNKISESVHFVRRFLKSPGSVGAVLPSSRYLAQAMIEGLELEPDDLVVEYGPGTGPFTAAIRRRQVETAGFRYLGIELDSQFFAALERRFETLDFHHGSVEDVETILRERGLQKAKAIISGLPFASLPRAVQEAVVSGTHSVLAEGGQFRTFQYVHAYGLPAARRFRHMMKDRFGELSRSAPVLRNVPPAYVLRYDRTQVT